MHAGMVWMDDIYTAVTYADDERGVAFLQSAAQPHKVLVAPPHLELAGVELTPRGLVGGAHRQSRADTHNSLDLALVLSPAFTWRRRHLTRCNILRDVTRG